MSVMALAGWISLAFLAFGALGALYRIIRRPGTCWIGRLRRRHSDRLLLRG